MHRVLASAFLLLLLAALLQAAHHHTSLPEQVATHFDLSGQPDAWMSRSAHTAFQAGLALAVGLIIGGLARFSDRIPARFINLPHRDYWFAPARRAASARWLAAMIHTLGLALLGFFMFLFHHVHQANLSGRPLQISTTPLIVGLFIFITGLVMIFMARFRRPPGAHPQKQSMK